MAQSVVPSKTPGSETPVRKSHEPKTAASSLSLRTRSILYGIGAAIILTIFIAVGSRGFHWFDAALIGYAVATIFAVAAVTRSEEHTSELQSQSNLVCRLLLETNN